MLRRFISLIICIGVMTSLVPIGTLADSYQSERLNETKIGTMEHFGYPITASQTNSSVCSVKDGNNIIAGVIEGQPSIFYIYDLDANKVLGNFPLAGVSDGSHGFGVAPNGDIYTTTQSTAKLYRYEVATGKFFEIATLPGQSASYQVSFDEEGNAYVGTYPDAKVFRYNPNTGEMYDYGTVFHGERYVRAHVYHEGYLYIGGYNDPTHFGRLNVKTGEVTMLKTPDFPGMVKGDNIKLFWFMDIVKDEVAGDFITALITPLEGTSCFVIYDLKEQKWVECIQSSYGYQSNRKTNDGVVYTVKVFPSGDGNDEMGSSTNNRIAGYNLRTKELIDTGIAYIKPGKSDGLRGASLVELKDQAKYPGKSIVTINYEFGVPTIINLETKKVDILKDVQDSLIQRPVKMRSIGYGGKEYIGYGGYKARTGGVFNINSNEFTKFPTEQIEDVEGIGGKVYYGKYAGACLYEFDPTMPVEDNVNPKQVARLYNEQDRIFDMTEADGKIVLSSYPITTSYTGALSIYDPKTGELDVQKPMLNHSITCSVYKDGLLYVGTNIWGGLATSPVVDEAKVLIYDMNTKKIIKEASPKVPGYDSPILNYGDLIFGDDGLLWCATKGAILAMDPKTLEVKKSKVLDGNRWSKTAGVVLFPQDLYRLSNGLFVTKSNGDVYLVDPDTMESKKILSSVYRLTVGEDGNIYYTGLYDFRKIPIYYKGEQLKSTSETEDKLKESIAIMLNKNVALVNGKESKIDAKDSSIVAKTVDGRTLVPFRFVAEAVGGEVKWDESINKASVNVNGKEVSTIIGENKIIAQGKEIQIDVPSTTEGGRTLLPLRAFVEALGKTVYWDTRGLILISNSELYEKNRDKELIDSIRYKISPEILVDLYGAGTTSPEIEERKKYVNYSPAKFVESESDSKWEKVAIPNLNLSQGVKKKIDANFEGAKGGYYYLPGMTNFDGDMINFRLINSGTAKEQDFSKNPEVVEVLKEGDSNILRIHKPVTGNSINMFMPVIKFDDKDYKKEYKYRIKFKAKRGSFSDDRPSQLYARVRYLDEAGTNLGNTELIEVPISDEYMEFTLFIDGTKIPESADRIAGLIYITSSATCCEAKIKDISVEVDKTSK